MSDYDDIKSCLNECISCLEVEKFSDGTLKDIQTKICNLANIVNDLNEYVKSIEDRVVILEGTQGL